MTKISITIKGLSIIYRMNGIWKVIFICDRTHKLHFLSSKNTEPLVYHQDLAYSDRDRILNFTNSDVVPAEPAQGQDFDKVFKMIGEYAHKDGIIWERKSFDNGFLLANYTIVCLSVPNSIVYTKTLTRAHYKVHNLLSNDKRDIGFVAKEVGIDIELRSGRVDLKDGNNIIAPIPFETDGTIHNIILDNDCRDSECTNQDFFMYYRLLTDALNPRQTFDAGQHISLNRRKTRRGTAGNCDPIDGGGGGGFLPNF
jgi:hypothetical protein